MNVVYLSQKILMYYTHPLFSMDTLDKGKIHVPGGMG